MKTEKTKRTVHAHPPHFWKQVWSSTALLCGTVLASFAANDNFALLSLEDLVSIKVTSVSKKSESLHGTAAAVSVISGDDLRRSGVQTLPDALRLCPGVEVGQVDSHTWAVSVRGFNETFAQKLLVLVDGRSVYNPLFSGVFWNVQDTTLDDVDRIEVIRGPGGTVWGANAVNGVINVTSKSARDTQGWLLNGGGGSMHQALANARYGGKLGEDLYFRIYGKYNDWGNTDLAAGGDANDAWWKGQSGFRLDWEPAESDRLTLQGDIYKERSDQTVTRVVLPTIAIPFPSTYESPSIYHQDGGNVLGRWTHEFSADADASIQAYYDRGQLKTPMFGEKRDTFDLDLQQRVRVGTHHEFVLGGGYRLVSTAMQNTDQVSMQANSRTDQIYNLFAQDEITLLPERLRWTLGTKVEHNDYTGVEFQPGTRLAWTPTEKQTVWASVARAVRTPSQFESDASVKFVGTYPTPFGNLPAIVALQGDRNFESETLIAYELGYRLQARENLTFDTALFFNDYEKLRATTTAVDLSTLPNYIQVTQQLGNSGSGHTYGGELTVTWQVVDNWRLRGQFSYMDADLTVTGYNSDPKFQTSLRSSVDLSRTVEWDLCLRYVDSLFANDLNQPIRIPSYLTLDMCVAWHPNKNLELALIGQNLAGSHREFVPTYISSQKTEVSPSVFGKVTWKF